MHLVVNQTYEFKIVSILVDKKKEGVAGPRYQPRAASYEDTLQVNTLGGNTISSGKCTTLCNGVELQLQLPTDCTDYLICKVTPFYIKYAMPCSGYVKGEHTLIRS